MKDNARSADVDFIPIRELVKADLLPGDERAVRALQIDDRPPVIWCGFDPAMLARQPAIFERDRAIERSANDRRPIKRAPHRLNTFGIDHQICQAISTYLRANRSTGGQALPRVGLVSRRWTQMNADRKERTTARARRARRKR